MYVIINKDTLNDIDEMNYYLAWQTPIFLGDYGYFWTYKNIFETMIDKSNSEHPYVFDRWIDAVKLLKRINIPQKCKIIK